jgi:uncharacterized protein (TIGR03382 family)
MRVVSLIAIVATSSPALFVARPAHATAEFPGIIQQHFGITCTDGGIATPDCIICHDNDNGGLGTVTRPFGVWMKANGLSAFNDSKLGTLLDQAKQEGIDTNCDGIPDIDQLESCDWPALETSGDACGADAGTPVTIFYGCEASPDPLPVSAALGVSGVMIAALVVRRRKKA